MISDMTKIYISLPIKGKKWEDVCNTERNARQIIELMGGEPISPLANGLPHDAPDHLHMQADYKMLLDCDAILLMDGWEYSHGCMNELQVAADCRKIILTDDMDDDTMEIKLLHGKR